MNTWRRKALAVIAVALLGVFIWWVGGLAMERARQCPAGTVYLFKFNACVEVPW